MIEQVRWLAESRGALDSGIRTKDGLIKPELVCTGVMLGRKDRSALLGTGFEINLRTPGSLCRTPRNKCSTIA
jgi:hypothetical protein